MADNRQEIATLIDEVAEQRKAQFKEFLSHEVINSALLYKHSY